MKKIISLLLCLVFATLALASCGNDGVGEDLDDSMKGYEKEELTLNFYIVGDSTQDIPTVKARINNHTAKEYKTKLEMFYIDESDYARTVIDALDAAKLALENETPTEADLNAIKNKPDFFLINSPEMMQELYDKGHLADLSDFFYPEEYERRVAFDKTQENKFHEELIKKTEGLQNSIAETLVSASIKYETVVSIVDDKGTTKEEIKPKHYCVPNNRVIGTYTYLLIDREAAKEAYLGQDTKLESYNLDNVSELIEAIKKAKNIDEEAVRKDYVKVVQGKYEDKAKYEAANYPETTQKYTCNIISYPEVAGFIDEGVTVPENVDNVFNSAFAVSKYTDIDRAMEMVYALNTDTAFQNYLQYGVENTNYVKIDGVVDTTDIPADNEYSMNPIYTGNMFNLLPSDFWTEEDKVNGKHQNDDSRVYEAPKASE